MAEITRNDSGALIPENVSDALLEGVSEYSAAFRLFRTITVPSKLTRFPVLSQLPVAYWVDGDTGLKMTSNMAWTNKYLTVEKLAVVVPIAEDVADDIEDGGGYDIWANVEEKLREAIGRKIDAGIVFGDDKPSTQPDSIVAKAITAGNTRTRGTAAANVGGIAEDFNQLFGTVEADGYGVNTVITDLTYKTKLRAARATDGQKLLDVSTGALDGVPVTYTLDGLWPSGASAAEAVAGNTNQIIIGIRRDFYMKIWREAVIQDDAGAIVFNFAQQNMVGLVVEFRVGWQYANPINYRQSNEALRFPFAVMQAPGE